jgi:hypothetical protein
MVGNGTCEDVDFVTEVNNLDLESGVFSLGLSG